MGEPSRGFAAIVLAAGASSRFGPPQGPDRVRRPKQLLPLDGEPMVAHVARAALAAAAVERVIVVLGHHHLEVAAAVAEAVGLASEGTAARLTTVLNPSYLAGGLSSSIRAGVEAVPPGLSGFVFLLGDQPLVRPQSIDALALRYRQARRAHPAAGSVAAADSAALANSVALADSVDCADFIVVSEYGGRRGHPVLFGASFRETVLALEGDEGGRAIMRHCPERVIEVPSGPEILLDVDTPADYRRLLKLWPDRRSGFQPPEGLGTG